MTQALLVVDAQNEFSPRGLRAVPNHADAMEAILARVDQARAAGHPIAWVQHHNKPGESRAFVPGTWGAELSPGLGTRPGFGPERLFTKDVFGAFAHMCVSTSAREALVRGFDVRVDARGVGARDLEHELLGRQTGDEVRRSALLQLSDMGVTVENREVLAAIQVG